MKYYAKEIIITIVLLILAISCFMYNMSYLFITTTQLLWTVAATNTFFLYATLSFLYLKPPASYVLQGESSLGILLIILIGSYIHAPGYIFLLSVTGILCYEYIIHKINSYTCAQKLFPGILTHFLCAGWLSYCIYSQILQPEKLFAISIGTYMYNSISHTLLIIITILTILLSFTLLSCFSLFRVLAHGRNIQLLPDKIYNMLHLLFFIVRSMVITMVIFLAGATLTAPQHYTITRKPVVTLSILFISIQLYGQCVLLLSYFVHPLLIIATTYLVSYVLYFFHKEKRSPQYAYA